MRFFIILAISLSVVLAGCTEGATKTGPGDDDDKFGDIVVDKDRGVIRGLVLDASITPIEGARVAIQSLGIEATSNADGAFLFKDLEPGSYFLAISKLGFSSTQTSTVVEAGIAAPPIVKVQLERDTANLPFTQVTQYTGYIQCGFGLPGVDGSAWQGGSVNPCAALDSINTFDVFVAGPVTAAQSELIWDGTNVLGDGLNFGHFDPNSVASNYATVDGGSPQTLLVNGTTIEEYNGIGYESFLLRVFPGSTSVSVVLEQEFEIINTNFYRFVPDEGWTYLNDGAHPIPS